MTKKKWIASRETNCGLSVWPLFGSSLARHQLIIPYKIDHNDAKHPLWTRFITPFLSWQDSPKTWGKAGTQKTSKKCKRVLCLFVLRLGRATRHSLLSKLGQYEFYQRCSPVCLKKLLQVINDLNMFSPQNDTQVLPKWQCAVWFWWCTGQLARASTVKLMNQVQTIYGPIVDMPQNLYAGRFARISNWTGCWPWQTCVQQTTIAAREARVHHVVVDLVQLLRHFWKTILCKQVICGTLAGVYMFLHELDFGAAGSFFVKLSVSVTPSS